MKKSTSTLANKIFFVVTLAVILCVLFSSSKVNAQETTTTAPEKSNDWSWLPFVKEIGGLLNFFDTGNKLIINTVIGVGNATIGQAARDVAALLTENKTDTSNTTVEKSVIKEEQQQNKKEEVIQELDSNGDDDDNQEEQPPQYEFVSWYGSILQFEKEILSCDEIKNVVNTERDTLSTSYPGQCDKKDDCIVQALTSPFVTTEYIATSKTNALVWESFNNHYNTITNPCGNPFILNGAITKKPKAAKCTKNICTL